MHESNARRSEFQPDHSVRLADGCDWVLPQPPLAVAPEMGLDQEYTELITWFRDAEDEVDRQRSELALVIYLLRRNYHLDPGELQSLLMFDTQSAEYAEFRRLLREVAVMHTQAMTATALAVPRPPAGRTWSNARRRSWMRTYLPFGSTR